MSPKLINSHVYYPIQSEQNYYLKKIKKLKMDFVEFNAFDKLYATVPKPTSYIMQKEMITELHLGGIYRLVKICNDVEPVSITYCRKYQVSEENEQSRKYDRLTHKIKETDTNVNPYVYTPEKEDELLQLLQELQAEEKEKKEQLERTPRSVLLNEEDVVQRWRSEQKQFNDQFLASFENFKISTFRDEDDYIYERFDEDIPDDYYEPLWREDDQYDSKDYTACSVDDCGYCGECSY